MFHEEEPKTWHELQDRVAQILREAGVQASVDKLIRDRSLEQTLDQLATEFDMSRKWARRQMQQEAAFLRGFDA